MKFTTEQNKILSEIYRRLNYFNNGNLDENLQYLALHSDAKIIAEFNLIKPFKIENARVLNWYSLTEIGKKFFKNYITKNKLSEKTNSKIFNGNYIKVFDYNLLNKNLDLNILEQKLDNALKSETKESLTNWLNEKRKIKDIC